MSDEAAEVVSLISDPGSPNCRICYCSSEEPLCTPCKCNGTVLYVHQSCMDRWVELRPKDWDGKCDVCQYKLVYEEHEISQGAVTWSVYFEALGKYLLSLFSFLLPMLSICASFLLNLKIIADHEDSMVYLTISSTVVNLQMAFFLMKFLKLPFIQRHLQWAKCPLPKVGQVKNPKKIRETSYMDVFKSDTYYALCVVGFVIVSSGAVQGFAALLPKPEATNATAEIRPIANESTEATPTTYTKKQVEMEALAFFLLCIFFLLEISSLVILPFYEFVNRCIRNALALIFGKVFNHLVTSFFVGWYVEGYNSALFAGSLFLDVAAGQLIVMELVEMYILGYGRVINVAVNTSLLRYPIQNVENKYRNGLTRIKNAVLYIVLCMVIFMIAPLYLTRWVVPEALPLNIGNFDSRNISEKIFGADHNKSDTLIKVFEGMNRSVQALFVFNVVSYAFPVWHLVFSIFGQVLKIIGAKKDSKISALLNFCMLVFTTVFFTASALTALTLGRLVLSLFPGLSDYEHDITAFGIGWLLLRLLGTTVIDAIRSSGIILTCACYAVLYLIVIRLLVESYNPVRVETIFYVCWIVIYLKHHKSLKDIFLNATTAAQRLGVAAAFLMPLYIGIWTGILPSSLETVKSFSSFKWFFLGYTLGVLVICLSIYSIYLLWRLHYHLRFEYEEIASVLLNYDPAAENAPPKNKIYAKLKPYGSYSICGYIWLSLKRLKLKKKHIGTNEEEMLQNVS
ncbi:hypothetical protein L596_029003 [Steinernema carpocapsae]|uniref:RING-CH-type domain-containing protein n=1 Tax=Steinernema carpocapsae TaxID=34508 RepID=A0A4U5LTC7_STECR|nr:hypothetical protein L596_029003 [Steinernema carpocapsae]